MMWIIVTVVFILICGTVLMVWSELVPHEYGTDVYVEPPMRTRPMRECATPNCARYGYVVWVSADLRRQLVMCGRCAEETVALRGGFSERLRP